MSERKATPRQVMYLNILLERHFGANRKVYLKEYYDVDSSKDLTIVAAGEIISRFNPDNPEVLKEIGNATLRVNRANGQKELL